jgi:thiol-disulfide isomerase/thioredoxin
MMQRRRLIIPILILLLPLISILAWSYSALDDAVDMTVHRAPDFGSGGIWLDEGAPAPHHIADYKGKVVLDDFWEYPCINCIRDFATVKRWYGKYHSYGFEVVGVHYGEFNIGFDVNNVRAAAQRFRLPWPVLADQQGTTWKAYASQGWPERYLINPKGDIVMSVFGEGNNRVMEEKLRALLAVDHPDVMKVDLDPDENAFTPQCGVPTQEMFAGEIYGRSAVDNLSGHHTGDVAEFIPPHSPPDGGMMLVGKWRVEKDGVISEDRGTGAELRYHAKELYAVLSPAKGKPVRVDVWQDGGALPKDSAGADVKFDAKGAYVDVTEARMYYLLRSPVFSGHLVSLEPEGAGLTLHSFTFGNNCQTADDPASEK